MVGRDECVLKRPHVLKLNKYPTSETTTSALDDLFAIWGRPDTIVSDNGPQFASKTFADWCNAHSIAHLSSAPFHPASNGEAERLVGVFKQAMNRAVREEKKSKHLALRELLQQYRVTPQCTTDRTPAEHQDTRCGLLSLCYNHVRTKRKFSRSCQPSRNSQSVNTSITEISQEIVRNGLLER